jgi:hypothetical protein
MSSSTVLSYMNGNLKFSMFLLNLAGLLTASIQSQLTQGVWSNVLVTAQQVSGTFNEG